MIGVRGQQNNVVSIYQESCEFAIHPQAQPAIFKKLDQSIDVY
jgi:hypothetical protein